MRYAFDIVKATGFNLPILNYAYGNNGYNKKVKELMKFCGFDRKVKTYNETQGSGAVHRYTMMELADRFALMNVAFDQDDFRVDECLDFLCKEK